MLCTRYFLNDFVRVLDLGRRQLNKRLSTECVCLINLTIHQHLLGASV